MTKTIDQKIEKQDAAEIDMYFYKMPEKQKIKKGTMLGVLGMPCLHFLCEKQSTINTFLICLPVEK